MKRNWMIASALGLALATPVAAADDKAPVSDAAMTKITTVCQICHGLQGDSIIAIYPRLNGQTERYLTNQLTNFREQKRGDPEAMAIMWGMASQLDDSLIADIAKYYASQKPTEAQTGGALADYGKEIFMNGAPAQNIPPCMACHGEHGEGSAEVPRIAGQHGEYLREQLTAFRNRLRNNEVMHANTKEMTDDQIEAIVSYLAND